MKRKTVILVEVIIIVVALSLLCINAFQKDIFNHKYPYEYINRFDELMERKARIVSFYDEIFAQKG